MVYCTGSVQAIPPYHLPTPLVVLISSCWSKFVGLSARSLHVHYPEVIEGDAWLTKLRAVQQINTLLPVFIYYCFHFFAMFMPLLLSFLNII